MAHLAIVGVSRAAYGVPTRERRSTPIIQPRIAVPRVLELSQRVSYLAPARAPQSAVIVYCVDKTFGVMPKVRTEYVERVASL